jgi:hypothetical protein
VFIARVMAQGLRLEDDQEGTFVSELCVFRKIAKGPERNFLGEVWVNERG